jgi:putative ABC transport system permease protein
MDTLWQDVSYGFRALRRNKSLIALAILSLAIGIGANTAIFSAVDVFMYKPLPYPDSDRLITVWVTNQERQWSQVSFSAPDFVDLRDRSRTMELAATRGGTVSLSGEFDAERLLGTWVTPGFFRVLGVQPALGRSFTAGEGTPGSDRVVIISDGLWRRRYGGDPELLGSSVMIDGIPHTVVGVMPRHFWYRSPLYDVWMPQSFTGEEVRDSHFLVVLGRLSGAVTREQAVGEAGRIMGQISADYPETSLGHGAMAETLHEDVFSGGFEEGCLIATVGVALLLLIACANVANLLLTHAAGREREVALRGALGAARARLVRQFLTEASIVAALGGLLGLGLSVPGIWGLISLMPPEFPRVHEIGLDPRVLGFTVVVTMLTGILFGMAPALQSGRASMTKALSEGGRGGTGARGGRLRKILVVVEVALSLVLLVSSALLVQGFARVRLADLGFDRTDVLTFETVLPAELYPDSVSMREFHTLLKSRIEGIPGVETVGATTALPLQGDSRTYYVLAGEAFDDPERRLICSIRYVLPGYFTAMDIPILRGREIESGDREGSTPVVVINRTLAERHWPDANPIGKQIVIASGPHEIVGVVADTRDAGADQEQPVMAFFPAQQAAFRFMDWAVEAEVPPESLVDAIRAEVRGLDPNIPAYDVMSIDRDLPGG